LLLKSEEKECMACDQKEKRKRETEEEGRRRKRKKERVGGEQTSLGRGVSGVQS